MKRLLTLLCTVCWLAAPPALAFAPGPGVSTLSQQCAISAAQAGKIAQKAFGGKIIDVKAARMNGRSVYRVKLLQKSGRIHTVLIDAASGRPLR